MLTGYILYTFYYIVTKAEPQSVACINFTILMHQFMFVIVFLYPVFKHKILLIPIIYLALIPPGTSQHLNGKVLIGLSKVVSPMPRYCQAVVTWPHHLANSLHWNFVNEYLFDDIDIHTMLNKVYQTYVYIYPLFYVFLCFIIFKTDHFSILTNGFSIKTMFFVYL